VSDTIWIAIISAGLNGAVVWGVVRTELKYLRRDVDHANKRIDEHEAFERRGQVRP
jgi:hypothetical protein